MSSTVRCFQSHLLLHQDFAKETITHAEVRKHFSPSPLIKQDLMFLHSSLFQLAKAGEVRLSRNITVILHQCEWSAQIWSSLSQSFHVCPLILGNALWKRCIQSSWWRGLKVKCFIWPHTLISLVREHPSFKGFLKNSFTLSSEKPRISEALWRVLCSLLSLSETADLVVPRRKHWLKMFPFSRAFSVALTGTCTDGALGITKPLSFNDNLRSSQPAMRKSSIFKIARVNV